MQELFKNDNGDKIHRIKKMNNLINNLDWVGCAVVWINIIFLPILAFLLVCILLFDENLISKCFAIAILPLFLLIVVLFFRSIKFMIFKQ